MAPLQLDLGILIILKGCHNCQLSIVNCQFGEAAKQQFIFPSRSGVFRQLFPTIRVFTTTGRAGPRGAPTSR